MSFIANRVADQRQQLESKGKLTVRSLTLADLGGKIPGIDNLDALEPDPVKRMEAEKVLAQEIRKITKVASYTGLSEVNTYIDEYACAVVESQLSKALDRQFQRALAESPAVVEELSLSNLGAIEPFVAKVAQAKWDNVSGKQASSDSTFARLPEQKQSELRDAARRQVTGRASLLLREAEERLDRLSKSADHRWPEVMPDSDSARRKIIAVARDKLLTAAGIPVNAGTQPVVAHANALAEAWFDDCLAAVVRSDQLAKLGKLKTAYSQYQAAKQRGKDAEFPLPCFPRPPEDAGEDDLEERLDGYVKIVLQEWEIEPDDAVEELRKGLAEFLRPVVKERLAYYKDLKVRGDRAREELGKSDQAGEVVVVPWPTDLTAGPVPRPTQPSRPDGVDSSDEAVVAVLEREVEARNIAEQIRRIQTKYKIELYELTSRSLAGLKLPEEAVRKLQGLVGTVFEDQRSFDAAVKKALAGLDLQNARHQIVEAGRRDPRAPRVSATSSYGNSRAVEHHRDQILEEMGYSSSSPDSQDWRYQQARAEAQKAAEELVARQKELLIELKARADQVAQRIKAKSVPGMEDALSPFGSLRTADKRVFGYPSDVDEIAREIADEVLPDERPEVRYDPAVVDALREAIEKASEPAYEEVVHLVQNPVWVPGYMQGQGVVRSDIISHETPTERIKAIEDALIAALQSRSADIVNKLGMPRVKQLINEHAKDLYVHIKSVPSPADLIEFRNYLRNTVKLGEGGISSRKALEEKGDLPAQVAALTTEIETKYPASNSPLAKYSPSDEFKNAIQEHAESLLKSTSGTGQSSSQGTGRSTQVPIVPTPPTPPTNRQPPEPVEPAERPQPEPPEELDLLVEATASADSASLEILIQCEAISLSAAERISFSNDREYVQGIQRVKGTLRGQAPDLIMKAFEYTQGKEARFAVKMDFTGMRVPMEMPRDLVNMLDELFKDWHEQSPLIQPDLQGKFKAGPFEGEVTDLRPEPTN